jgi:hypothetical protein
MTTAKQTRRHPALAVEMRMLVARRKHSLAVLQAQAQAKL